MANFDLDDPLGDLLSDGSNDSFFEEPKVTKRSSLTKTPEKKSVSDLFGIDNATAKKEPVKKDDDWLGVGAREPEKRATPPATAKPVKKISFETDDDILDNLGLDKKQAESRPDTAKTDASKKMSLMESILGPSKAEEKSVTTFDDILKASQLSKRPESGPKPMPARPPDVQPALGPSSLDAPREGRRSRQQSNLMDPLGLFSSEPKAELEGRTQSYSSPVRRRGSPSLKAQDAPGGGDAAAPAVEVIFPAARSKDMKTKSTPNLSELPDWLGGGSPVKTHKSDMGIAQQEQPAKHSRQSSFSRKEEGEEVLLAHQTENPSVDALLTQQKLATSHMEYQNTAIALQQQESQLLMALQLKKYEENLGEMQRKQQDILVKQEQQFNSLLERQFAKQQIMENNMRLQQERINNHIQMLLSQPPVSGAPVSEERDKVHELKKTSSEESARLYEEMIASLKQHTHEETFLLEESYKKQIATLEQSIESTEARMKGEIDYLAERQKEKTEKLQQEHEADVAKYKQRIEEMAEHHSSELKTIRENHQRVIEEIKYEYSTLVENIKETKQTESALFQNSNEYAQKIDTTLKVMDVNSRALLEMREKVEKDYGILSVAREESLKGKEEEIKLMRIALEKARETADEEKAQLMALVRNLEIKLSEQIHDSREERWAFQQATATLVARSSALDRESEFNRASVEREREQLKTLKESLLAEQEKIMVSLTEEKLTLSAEKARLETTAQLNQSYDSQRAKAEVEAAIQVAKEAAERTDREREILLKRQCEIESLKRNLMDRDRKLTAREREIDALIENTEQKAREGEQALMEARTIQANYNERLKDIQNQLVSLTNREKRLAEEKIAMSKERLALHTQVRLSKRCSLCAVDSSPKVVVEENTDTVEQDYTQFPNIIDQDLFRLRMQLSEEQLSNNLDSNYN